MCIRDSQMGRWFGFREGMRDYMKIWISDGMVEAFEYVARALNEFRDTVRLMMDRKRQPKDFGLKIRRAPSHLRLMVTAPNKRRTAKTVVCLLYTSLRWHMTNVYGCFTGSEA